MICFKVHVLSLFKIGLNFNGVCGNNISIILQVLLYHFISVQIDHVIFFVLLSEITNFRTQQLSDHFRYMSVILYEISVYFGKVFFSNKLFLATHLHILQVLVSFLFLSNRDFTVFDLPHNWDITSSSGT